MADDAPRPCSCRIHVVLGDGDGECPYVCHRALQGMVQQADSLAVPMIRCVKALDETKDAITAPRVRAKDACEAHIGMPSRRVEGPTQLVTE